MSKHNPVKLQKNNGKEKNTKPKTTKGKEYLQLNDSLDAQKTFHQKQYWPEKRVRFSE